MRTQDEEVLDGSINNMLRQIESLLQVQIVNRYA